MNKNLAHLAIIGALGDRQDQGENSSLIGLNRNIVKDAIDNHLCTDFVSVWFYDRTRDLITSLKRLNIEELTNSQSLSQTLSLQIRCKKGGIYKQQKQEHNSQTTPRQGGQKSKIDDYSTT